MAEEAKTEQKFLEVEEIHVFLGKPERLILIPHVGPEGPVGGAAKVTASELRCFGCARSVIYGGHMIHLYMHRRPPVVCTLEEGILTCEPEEG